MPEPTTPPLPLMKEIIPAEFHDRAYMKDWLEKPADKDMLAGVFKKLDGAETLIGKKTLIPGADAKPEEMEQFLGKLRPEKAEDYEVKVGDKPDEDFIKEFRNAAHYAGMNKAQVSRLTEKLAPVFKAQAEAREKAQTDAAAVREADYDKAIKEMTGGVDFAKKEERVRAVAKELVPEAARQFVDKIDDKSLALFVVFADAILSKYASEDDLNSKGKGAGGESDKEALLNEAKAIYANPAWRNFQHPDHDKLVKREAEIFAHPVFKT